jgi:hypothetical protein
MRFVVRMLRMTATVTVLAEAVAATPGAAQVAYDAPSGRVEVLGLHTWTLEMLQDSIRRRFPGQRLEDAACMVTLRDSLHFADALVQAVIYSRGASTAVRNYLVVKLIEPQETTRVRWAPQPPDTFAVLRPAYAAVILPATDSLGRLLVGRLFWPLQFYARDSAARARALKGGGPTGPEDASRLWRFLAEHRAESDRRTALIALRRDGFYANRVVAAAVLANFADRDSTWWSLTEALRDPNEAVRIAASTVLSQTPARAVAWAPLAPTLRLLLGGTNLPAMEGVFTILARTRVSPSLAKALLGGDGAWVLEHLRTEYPGGREAAHALLVQLNGGEDLGTSADVWARWIAGL